MDNNELRNLQLKQLYIAKNIKRICDKHEIKYILNGGTLLGAVRHKGFIPWDDDLDLGMLRNDYEKFLEIAKEELGKEFFIQTWDSDRNYALPFAKIRLNGTTYEEYNTRNIDIHKGVFVDIFPYDNLSDNKIIQLYQKIITKIFMFLLLNKCKYDYFRGNKKVFYIILNFLAIFFSKEFIKNTLYRIMTKYNDNFTKNIITFGGANSLSKETIPHRWLNVHRLMFFEDSYFTVPLEWDNFLKHFYGDYMTPPPENERHNKHNIIKIDLES